MMRLRKVLWGEFCKSERTLFEEWSAKNKALSSQLGPNDVIAFVSMLRSQIIFVWGFDEFKDDVGASKTVLQSRKYRMIDDEWDPACIALYAKKVGIHLTNFALFEDHFGYRVNGRPVSSHGQLRAVA